MSHLLTMIFQKFILLLKVLHQFKFIKDLFNQIIYAIVICHLIKSHDQKPFKSMKI